MTKNKANSILGIIKRGVLYKFSEVTLKLYRSYVKLHLEYFTQFWILINIKDVDMLEGVKRKAVKIISNLRNLSYEERLKRLDRLSLKHRRLKGDMTEVVFKMIYGIDKIILGKPFYMDGRTRSF